MQSTSCGMTALMAKYAFTSIFHKLFLSIRQLNFRLEMVLLNFLLCRQNAYASNVFFAHTHWRFIHLLNYMYPSVEHISKCVWWGVRALPIMIINSGGWFISTHTSCDTTVWHWMSNRTSHIWCPCRKKKRIFEDNHIKSKLFATLFFFYFSILRLVMREGRSSNSAETVPNGGTCLRNRLF